jgi:hypothetical protein
MINMPEKDAKRVFEVRMRVYDVSTGKYLTFTRYLDCLA